MKSQRLEHHGRDAPQTDSSARAIGLWLYLLLSLGAVCYVGFLTGNRSEMPDADAWEHHRAVLAMGQDL